MKSFILLFSWASILALNAQVQFSYNVKLEAVSIPNLPGLHSFAHAQHDGKWLIIGGRTDGIHPRQPFASFPVSDNNTSIYVVDPVNKAFWSASLSSLPTSVQEQLQSTNMNFHQVEDTLYVIGGYAFSATANDHITFPNLTTVRVSGLIQAVMNAQPISGFFKQINDSRFAVTGGQLNMLDHVFYLVGGQRFDGRYNPMGHNTYVQTYSSEIRKFEIKGAATTPVVINYSTIPDAVHLHRRDYNLLPQIFPDGSRGLTISSGVFQTNVNLPYLYPVDIKAGGIIPQTSFNQYLSHYHSAHISLYDSVDNTMHNLFFGGMSQYQYVNGVLIEDTQVPFVKTISRMSRAADGSLHEFVLNTEMPGLKGSGAEFILNQSIPHDHMDIIRLSQTTGDSLEIGYIYGGIESSAPNPFSSNQTNLTQADANIYRVILVKSAYAGENRIEGKHSYTCEVFPNPATNQISVSYNLDKELSVNYHITDMHGRLIKSGNLGRQLPGKHTTTLELPKTESRQLFLTLILNGRCFVSKPILINQ